METITQYSAVFLSTLLTSQLFKKVQMRMSLTFQWVVAYLNYRALFPFHIAQYQKDSFLDAIMWLIFKLVHFIQYNRTDLKKIININTLTDLF